MNKNHGTIIDAILGPNRVMPVVTIDNIDHALPLADALLEGGINVMEITLRTDIALKAVATVCQARPEMKVGTGTVQCPDDLRASQDAGAQFYVSPGLNDLLARAAQLCDGGMCPLLPGCATASDVMAAMAYGFERLKFFPAIPAGGVDMLKALHGPLQQAKFCPTGGLTIGNAAKFLALPNVFCIGGSWLSPRALMHDQNWQEITRRALAASAL